MELWQRLILEQYNTRYLEMARTLEPVPMPTWEEFMARLTQEALPTTKESK